jgi:hypothetical protein
MTQAESVLREMREHKMSVAAVLSATAALASEVVGLGPLAMLISNLIGDAQTPRCLIWPI